MILGLRTVVYYVPEDELERAKKWYSQTAGVAPYYDTPYYVGFNVGGFELGVHPGGQAPGSGGSTAYWGTPDIVKEVERLITIGAVLTAPIQDVGEGIKVATLADPFGNHFGVIENPHFQPGEVK